MQTSATGRISADIPNGQKSKFNLSHDNNTTYDWGSVQPILSKMMMPDSSINIELEQLKRLAPMVVPTFGRVKSKNISHFIPIDEIWPNWQAMLSQTKVTRPSQDADGQATSNTYIPKYVPYIKTNILAMYTLIGARVNIYFSGVVGSIDENVWVCPRNTNTYNSPSWNAATTAARDYLEKILAIANSETPNTAQLPEFSYEGYTMNLERLVLDKDYKRVFTGQSRTGAGEVPSISTMLSKPLQNANGNGYTHSASNEQNNYDLAIGDEHITFKGADYIWEYDGEEGGITSTLRNDITSPVYGTTSNFFDSRKIRITFKLSSFGKRLSKTLIGLGYNINLSDTTEVSLLPLIAYYKAWWDTYAPERYRNFYETAAWKLVNTCMQTSNAANVTAQLQQVGHPTIATFKEFISDLGTCFATERMDVVSAATDNFYGQTNTTTTSYDNNSITQAIVDTIKNTLKNVGSSAVPAGVEGSLDSLIDKSWTNAITNPINAGLRINTENSWAMITQPQLDALKKAYIGLNKASAAGMKVEEILRALGQGDYVEECKGKFINGSDDLIKISDVIATAATEDAKLGQYGGRGLGTSVMQISYTAKNHGYLIVLSCIVPESGYVNSPAHENTAISFEKMFQPEFDGISYEAIQKKAITGSTLINDPTCNDTFGFLPTYTQFKFMCNKANGDFRLNSTRASMRPYSLDKYIPVDDVGVYSVEETNGHPGSTTELCTPTFKYEDTPNAGEDWRYVNKFPWNGDYNRIFAASDDGIEWSVFSPNNNAFLYLSFEYDNIMIHNVFTIQYWAHMKAIEDSYNTYDHEHGAPKTTIQKA